jgi:hypothetical protein
MPCEQQPIRHLRELITNKAKFPRTILLRHVRSTNKQGSITPDSLLASSVCAPIAVRFGSIAGSDFVGGGIGWW